MSKALATKNVAAVLLSLGIVLAASFAFAVSANAQTTTTTTTTSTSLSTLQAQVQALLAQIAALQGTGTATSGTGACFTFTQNEQKGSSGGQVMWIQEFLNGHGFQVAASGAGSPGNESSYFGALTKAAVIKFQNAYAAQILTPEGLTTGTGNWFAGSRAEANAICASQTTTTTTTTGTGTGTGTTVGNGTGITVSAAAQPANSLAPQLANRVPFTTFTITNTSGAAVTINGINVQRTGLAADAAFAGVELIDQNGIQIGTSRTFNSNHQAEVGTPWTLAAGATMTYTIAGNMSANEAAYAGQVASLSVIGIDTSVPVSGTLPITGASQTINASLTIGTANVQVSSFDPGSSRSEAIGTTGIIFSGIRIQAGSAEPEKLYSITWNQTGSVGSTDLANLVTIVDGVSYPMTVDSSGKYYTATFPGGLLIGEGNSVDAYVQGDITGSDASGRTAEFDIYRSSDIYLVGQTYGYGITPTYTGSLNTQSGNSTTGYWSGSTHVSAFTDVNPFFEGAQVSITAGTLSTISNAGSVGSQNIAINVPNQPLGGFTTNFTGEPVTVQTLTFTVASSTNLGGNLTNVSLVDQNGNTVAGPVDENSAGQLVYNSSVTFPVGPMTYTLKGTVPSTTGINGTTYTISTNPGSQWTGAQGESSGSTVSLPSTTITLNTMTVQGGSLTISASSNPASTTVAPGASNFTIANINLDASQSGEDIRLSSLPVVVNASSTNTGALDQLANALTNCQLFNGATALNNQSIGGTTGWSVGPTNETSGLEANFVFQNSLTIPKGTVVTLSLECNIASSIGTQDYFSAGVNTNFAPSPTGAASGNSIVPVVQTSASGTMTPGTATLAVTVPTPISYAQVAGGTTGVSVGTFTLQPTSDSVNLQQVGLALNSNFASSSDLTSAGIYNSSGTPVGSVLFTSGSTAVIGGTTYYVATSTLSTTNIPQNVQAVFTIKASIAQIGTGQSGTSGHEIRIRLADAHGSGSSSGTAVDSGVGPAQTTGIAIFRSYPTVAQVSSLFPTNGIADGRLIAFSVTANAAGPVGLDKLSFTLSTSTATVTSPSLYVYTDSGFSNPAGGTVGGVGGVTTQTGTGSAVSTTFSTPLEIPAGTTEYFLLKGTVSGCGSTCNVATTLTGDSTDLAPGMFATTSGSVSGQNFIWSPNSTTTSATSNNDWTNGFGVSGLPSIGITENRTQ